MLTLAQTLSVKSFVKVADVRIVLSHARNEIAIFSSSVRVEPVPIREIEGLRSSRSYRDITEADDGSAIHIRSQPLPPWLLFIGGSLDTNAVISCETQRPILERKHPRRIVATLPRANAKCDAARPIVPVCRQTRRRSPHTPLLNWQSNPSSRLG